MQYETSLTVEEHVVGPSNTPEELTKMVADIKQFIQDSKAILNRVCAIYIAEPTANGSSGKTELDSNPEIITDGIDAIVEGAKPVLCQAGLYANYRTPLKVSRCYQGAEAELPSLRYQLSLEVGPLGARRWTYTFTAVLTPQIIETVVQSLPDNMSGGTFSTPPSSPRVPVPPMSRRHSTTPTSIVLHQYYGGGRFEPASDAPSLPDSTVQSSMMRPALTRSNTAPDFRSVATAGSSGHTAAPSQTLVIPRLRRGSLAPTSRSGSNRPPRTQLFHP